MPVFRNLERNIAIFMKEKETLVYKLTFPKPSRSIGPELRVKADIAYRDITEEKISHALTS